MFSLKGFKDTKKEISCWHTDSIYKYRNECDR